VPRRGLVTHNFLLEICAGRNELFHFGQGYFARRHSQNSTTLPLSATCWSNITAAHTRAQNPHQCGFCARVCPGEDLNLHALRHMHLKHTCLPITPPGQVEKLYYNFCFHFFRNRLCHLARLFFRDRFYNNRLITLHMHHPRVPELATYCLSRLLADEIQLRTAHF
jgi:hypothetical protein